MDFRFDGLQVRWTSGSMDFRFDGLQVRWTSGSMDFRFDDRRSDDDATIFSKEFLNDLKSVSGTGAKDSQEVRHTSTRSKGKQEKLNRQETVLVDAAVQNICPNSRWVQSKLRAEPQSWITKMTLPVGTTADRRPSRYRV
jgi:hypothetical protein